MNGQELFLKSKCPICGNPFVNDFHDRRDLHIKQCHQIDHKMIIVAKDSRVDNISILIKCPRLRIITWLYNNNTIKLRSVSSFDGSNYLEWFEPDFSDYKKLIKKIKTYITFS